MTEKPSDRLAAGVVENLDADASRMPIDRPASGVGQAANACCGCSTKLTATYFEEMSNAHRLARP
ncbi:hypothetical protein, partial [Pseudomonas aeruginosa]